MCFAKQLVCSTKHWRQLVFCVLIRCVLQNIGDNWCVLQNIGNGWCFVFWWCLRFFTCTQPVTRYAANVDGEKIHFALFWSNQTINWENAAHCPWIVSTCFFASYLFSICTVFASSLNCIWIVFEWYSVVCSWVPFWSVCVLSLPCLCTCASDHLWRDWPDSQSPAKPRLVEPRLAPIRPIGAACIAFRRQLITSLYTQVHINTHTNTHT